MAFVDDLARIREVLQANAVDKVVAEDMLIALLELYASDNQRVDLVVLDLQAMLGKDLSVGQHFAMQQQRWEELHKPPEIPNPTVPRTTIAAEVVMIDKNRPSSSANVVPLPKNQNKKHISEVSTSYQQRWEELNKPQKIPNPADQNRPSTSANVFPLPINPNKRHLSEVSTESSRAKKRTPPKIEKVLVSAAAVNSVYLAGENKQVAPVTKKLDYPPGRPITASSTAHGAVRPNLAGTSSETVQVLDNATAVVISSTSASRTLETTDGSVIQPAGTSNNEANSKDICAFQEISMKFHKATLSAVPDINVKYSTYKATEFVMLRKSPGLLDEYIGMIVADANLAIPKVDVNWNPPVLEINPEHQRLFQNVYDSFINEKVEFLVRAVPDADPDFLEERVNSFQGDQEKIRGLLTDILEGNLQVPTRADYNRRKEYNVLANKFFTVEEFFELYDDPLRYFTDDARVTDFAYREQAINQLKKDFKFASLTNIRRVFAIKNSHYTPTYFELHKNPTSNQRKTKRSPHECMGTAKDLFLIQEIAFVGLLPEIESYLQNKEQMRKDAVTLSRANGSLLDCPICCEDELIGLDLIYCSKGHGVCRNCVRRQSEELIGLMKNHVSCLFPECSTEYTLHDLKEVLKKSIFGCLEKRRQAEEVLAAGIEGIESCPFCEYSVVPGEGDRLFNCRNPECSKISCRQCRELNHSPLRCEEYAMKQRLNNYVETKMTEALVRQCPSCKKNFVKADGCNKMVCPCGTIMCYVCREKIKDYHHFSNVQTQLPNQPAPVKPAVAKCPLYSDTLKMHEEEVAKSAAKARADLASSNPNIRIDLVLGKK